MKKYLYITVICLLVCSSCKKFLDVQPESDVTKEQLFSSEDGFKEALNGVYNYCAGKDLYGGRLTFDIPELMAQNYDPAPGTDRNIQAFIFTERQVIDINDGIWKNGYKAIGYCNAILEAIDAKKNIFSGTNYELVKGEALTLRAYLHFDMLRLFAPSFKSNPSFKAIPYVTTVSINATPFSTTTEVLDKVVADLTTAKQLLKSDPIIPSGYKVGYPNKRTSDNLPIPDNETSSASLFLQNRRHRMNYYTACGELARVYLYKEDYSKSLENATEVINANKFPWSPKEDVFKSKIGQRDKIFYPELISCWYMAGRTLREQLEGYYSNDNAAYSPTIAQKDLIFEKGSVGVDDWRWIQWFRDVPSTNSTSRALLVKYVVNPDADGNLHPMVAPAMRLSEMYYIAAEASFDADKTKAINYFNTVREHRGIGDGLPASIDKTEFLRQLIIECRKEFFSEGQVFYMYKRLNRDITNTNGMVYSAGDKIFVLPLPIDEQAYRN
ncbi:MAG: RagB/SusD family nutrient uptake outer membrane protein [Pedobacter sp.]|nr:MAG: RagB/SusD family nutrient uptake outer membrane protein [Pedobacter sp.]